MKREILRIIDANFNRSREGLRVCEEIVRFILNDTELTKQVKNIRHAISRSIKKLPGRLLLESRRSLTDAGKNISSIAVRRNWRDVFFANIQRVKEALRVLEEFASITNQSLGRNFARIRFKVYELEKRIIARL